MSATTIKRKALRNRIRAKGRKAAIKRLTAKPTLKKIDIEAVKASFEKSRSGKSAKKIEKVDKEEPIHKEPVQTTVATEDRIEEKPEAKAVDASELKSKDKKEKQEAGEKKAVGEKVGKK